MPIPGTKVKIIDPNTHKELATGEEGMIVIAGIQVMKGYLKDKEKTSQVLIKIKGQTFYITGDKGRVDEHGFLTIVDRYSRFAKLAGEMVSLGAIEEKISKLIISDDESEVDFITTTLEDDKKGEKVVLLITGINENEIALLKEKMIETFDNKLMIPSIIKIVDEIPKLGTGKKDFKGTKELAKSLV